MSSLQLGVAGVELVPQSTGYGLLIGLGVAFCGVILIALKIQKAYLAEDSGTSEMFMVANRSVGTGLTASAVFSSWMWINETVFAAAMCYRFGIAVPLVSIFKYSWKIYGENRIDGFFLVVGYRSLLPDSPDGCAGGSGKDPSSIRSHIA
jgi:hypothetical protein